jgi:hypothetical protein
MRRLALVGLFALVLAGPAAAAPSVNAGATPATVLFGQPFRYVVEAQGSRQLRVLIDPGAFDEVGAPSTHRTDGGVRVEVTLVCLQRSCVPGNSPRRVTMPAPRVIGAGGVVHSALVVVTVKPRVPGSAVAASRPAYRLQTALPPSHARQALAWSAAALAVVLLALAVWLARTALRRVVGVEAVRNSRSLDVARALRLLRESASRTVPDRRKAADYAARAVGAAAATELAWASPPPDVGDVIALADELEARA